MKNYYPADFRVVAKRIGANFNVTTDQTLPIEVADTDDLAVTGEQLFTITNILVTNASVSLTTAVGGIYTAAAKSGPIVSAGQVYSALTAANKFVLLTLSGTALTDVVNQANLYLSLTTPQGVAATADVYVYGRLFQKN